MTAWTMKRFWTNATAEPTTDGYTVRLDARGVRTPAKAPLVVPTLPMAAAIAAEWQAQTGKIDPLTMPVTRSANAAIDKVATQFDEVADLIAAYGASDLLCYRAEGPGALVAQQAAAWDPLLDWASTDLGARLRITSGIVPVPQPAEAIAKLDAHVRKLTPFGLTALHDLVAMSGSLIIGLAVLKGRIDPDDAWQISRIDEDWQAALWGRDDEAEARAAHKRQDFVHAHRFWCLQH